MGEQEEAIGFWLMDEANLNFSPAAISGMEFQTEPTK